MENTERKRPIVGMKNLAQFLGVHYNTVYNWKRSGLLKYKRAGATLIFDPEDYLVEYQA